MVNALHIMAVNPVSTDETRIFLIGGSEITVKHTYETVVAQLKQAEAEHRG